MKLIVEFNIEIDGELSEHKAKNIFRENFEPKEVVWCSENYPDYENEDWAIIITGWKVE